MADELLDDFSVFEKKQSPKNNKWLLRLLYLQGVMVIGFTGYAWLDVESIIYTGILGTSLGCIIAFLAYKQKAKKIFYIGLSVPAIALLCLVLIAGLRLSPRDAQMPIPILLTLYTIISTWLIYQQWKNNSK